MFCTGVNIIKSPKKSDMYPGIKIKIDPKIKKRLRLFFSIFFLSKLERVKGIKLFSKKSLLLSESKKKPSKKVVKISINEIKKPISLKKIKKRLISKKGNKSMSKIIFNF